MAVRDALRLWRYRVATGWRARLTRHAATVVTVALLGGLALAAVSAGRRTQSSYPAFLRRTNPADLTFSTYGSGPGSPANAYSPALAQAISRLPNVRHVEAWVGVFMVPLTRAGAPDLQSASQLNLAGSRDGLYFDEDRATPVRGRMADPRRADEFVATELAARLMGWHVGSVVPMGRYGPAEVQAPGFGTPAVPPVERLSMHLVGLVVFNNEVVEDDADRLPTNVLFTPALTRRFLAARSTQGTWYGLQLVHGSRDVAAIERAIDALLPAQNFGFFRETGVSAAKVEDAVRPESLALAVFGVMVGAAALVLAALSIARQLHASSDERATLRALGAGPVMAGVDDLLGVAVAVVAGTLLAIAVAVGLSPLSPLGPVRRVAGGAGLAPDRAVLGLGSAAMVLALVATAFVITRRISPYRRGGARSSARPGTLAGAAARAGMPAPVVVGIRFATESGKGRASVPVRSALAGSTVAVLLVVATVTFAAGLRGLVTHPALFGWNWDYDVSSVNDVPQQALSVLDADPRVSYSGYAELTVQIDGRSIPSLIGTTALAVQPPVLSGHALRAKNQILLGAATLAALGKHVGGTVLLTIGTAAAAPFYVPPTPLTIAGTVTMPAITTSATLADHPTMGTGAVIDGKVMPASFLAATTNPDPTLNGPTAVLVRFDPSVSRSARLAEVTKAAAAANRAFDTDPQTQGDSVDVLGVQRPAEIVNYRTTGAMPAVLAGGLAAGAFLSLMLTLLASVRRRRRDLAVLKTLGFTPAQLAGSVVWQATVTAAVGVVIGVPLGIAAGRQLWIAFARQIYAVPRPTVPWTVAAVALGALAVTALAAAVPGGLARRTPAAELLRAEA